MNKKRLFSLILAAIIIMTASILPVYADLIDDNLNQLRAMLNQYEFHVYRESKQPSAPYYGAKFEPKDGIYFGTPFNDNIPGVQNSIDAEYFWFGTEYDSYIHRESGDTGKHLRCVNWNFNQSGLNPADYDSYIRDQIQKIAATGDDILLVFGKEMNIIDNLSAEDFRAMFRYVANIAHQYNNIAMVWGANAVGSLAVTFEQFYPGDEYVDWIGTSLYIGPLFDSNRASSQNNEGNNVGFITGDYANPIMNARPLINFVTRNSINKPIMVTEGGVGFISNQTGEDFTEWAKQQLAIYYKVLPRIYPQMKIFINFNVAYEGGGYRYDIGSSPALYNIVADAVNNDPIYLKGYNAAPTVTYPSMTSSIFSGEIKLSAAAYVTKDPNAWVTYLVDGNEAHSTNAPPYSLTLNTGNLSQGQHQLTVQMVSGGSIIEELTFDIRFTDYIYVTVNGERVEFDTPPIIENDRTLVPIRAIGEKLGFTVNWNPDDQTITMTSSDTTVRLQLNNHIMTVNGTEVEIDVPPTILFDRTIVPIRAVSEAFNATVTWVPETKTVVIVK